MLGNIPWSADDVRLLFFRDFQALQRALRGHPGHEVHSATNNLRCSLDIFDDSKEDLLSEITSFRQLAQQRKLFARKYRDSLDARIRRIRRSFYCAVLSGWGLVDHCRRVTERVEIPELVARLSTCFDPGIHEFMRVLRTHAAHVLIPEPRWRVSFDAADLRAGFVLRPADLPKIDNAMARRFAETHTVIDVDYLIARYSEQVHQFYEWFLPEVETRAGAALQDYRRCNRLIRKLAFCSEWRVWLNAEPTDPASVRRRLLRRLTFGEAKGVLRLPLGSLEQADLIIETLDEEGLLDQELREETRRSLGVP